MPERTWISILATGLALAGLASSAQAACVAGGTCSLVGNARFEHGFLVVPATAGPPPSGPILATSMATVMQGAVAPRSLQLGGAELTHPGFGFAITLPVFLLNTQLFQIQSAATIQLPAGPATFAQSGRTGSAVASWCPGFALPAPAFNPGCGNATLGVGVKGRLRYFRTANQFGGPGPPAYNGSRNFALRFGSPAPCSGPGCIVGIAIEALPPTLATGASFGFNNVSVGPLNMGGVFEATVTAAGLIVGGGAVLGDQSGITRVSWGGPWTTGSLTVSVTVPGIPNSVVMLQGTDLRSPGGSGVVSLVSGALVLRSLGGAFFTNTMDLGYMTLMVPEPGPMVGAATALAVLALSHFAVQRRSGGRAGR